MFGGPNLEQFSPSSYQKIVRQVNVINARTEVVPFNIRRTFVSVYMPSTTLPLSFDCNFDSTDGSQGRIVFESTLGFTLSWLTHQNLVCSQIFLSGIAFPQQITVVEMLLVMNPQRRTFDARSAIRSIEAKITSSRKLSKPANSSRNKYNITSQRKESGVLAVEQRKCDCHS